MTHPHETAVDLVQVWRGDLLENIHRGHAVVCDDAGQPVFVWGDPAALIYPRSACKMIQALPLIESGAAAAYGLTDAQLALACASHQSSKMHVSAVGAWLDALGLGDDAFRCGPQMPWDREAKETLIRAFAQPIRIHNCCSGKHAGFLTLGQHLGADPDYDLIDHPVQKACKAAFEDVTGMASPFHALDGCSAPNFATEVQALARAMAYFAAAHTRTDARSHAAARLTVAMGMHPEMVAGDGQACTELMRAMDGKVAVKFGADGVYTGIIPEKRMGIALKIADGSKAAAQCAVAAILVKLGVLDVDHPTAQGYLNRQIRNQRGQITGFMRPTENFQ